MEGNYIKKNGQELDTDSKSLQRQIRDFIEKTDENIDSSSDDEVLLTDNEKENNLLWIKDSNELDEKDKLILKSKTASINDNIINCAQFILHKQFPYVSGFQNTHNSKNVGFLAEKKGFIQIVDVNDNHWVTITSKDLSTVHIYDSKRPNR